MNEPRYIVGGSGQGQSSSSGGGGYKGVWTAGSYAQGDTVRRGPFIFGAAQATSVDPCDVSNPGSSTDWTLAHNGGGLQSGNVARLVNATTGQSGSIYRNTTLSTWASKRLICDALVGPAGGADVFCFGFFDSSFALTFANAFQQVGFYGVAIDIYNTNNNAAVAVVDNGVISSRITLSQTTQVSGNSLLETDRFFRYYADFTESGSNMIATLWRDAYDATTAASIEAPGFLGTWTITKPSYTNCRVVASAQAGGIAGNFKVRSLYTLDTSGAWHMMSMFPHAPRIDTSVW